MFFGSHYYNEGAFPPERGGNHNWHVHCKTGALEVLQTKEYVEWLAAHPGRCYTINFANGSSARIESVDELWKALTEISKTFIVEVFPLGWTGKYVRWSGDVDRLCSFDAISICAKVNEK